MIQETVIMKLNDSKTDKGCDTFRTGTKEWQQGSITTIIEK